MKTTAVVALLLGLVSFSGGLAFAAETPPPIEAPMLCPASTPTVTPFESQLDGATFRLSCEEQLYLECLDYCYGRAQEGSCTFFANQQCLCMRTPADCPLCY